jgi:hypothetical protein
MYTSPINPWPPGPEHVSTVNVYCGYGARPQIELPDDPAVYTSVTMPRLGKFKNKAVLADLTAVAQRVDTRHVRGINVLYGDSSAEWVDRKVIDHELRQCTSINAMFNPRQDAIWKLLDR